MNKDFTFPRHSLAKVLKIRTSAVVGNGGFRKNMQVDVCQGLLGYR